MPHVQQFVGKYRMIAQDNLDEYLKAIGVSAASRAMAGHIKAEIDCKIVDDEWQMKVHTGIRDINLNFKAGDEKEIDTLDGRHVKTTFTVDDDKLIIKEHWDGKEATIVHHIDGDEWTATMTCAGVRCVRHFKRE